jgi:hypothetical protein
MTSNRNPFSKDPLPPLDHPSSPHLKTNISNQDPEDPIDFTAAYTKNHKSLKHKFYGTSNGNSSSVLSLGQTVKMNTTFWLNDNIQNTRSSFLSSTVNESLKSTLRLGNVVNKVKKNKEDKIGIFHAEDWKNLRSFSVTKKNKNIGGKSQMMGAIGGGSTKNGVKLPTVSIEMMDSILRRGKGLGEGKTGLQLPKDRTGIELGYGKSYMEINKHLMKRLIIDKLLKMKD